MKIRSFLGNLMFTDEKPQAFSNKHLLLTTYMNKEQKFAEKINSEDFENLEWGWFTSIGKRPSQAVGQTIWKGFKNKKTGELILAKDDFNRYKFIAEKLGYC